jgi:hypothetical protein
MPIRHFYFVAMGHVPLRRACQNNKVSSDSVVRAASRLRLGFNFLEKIIKSKIKVTKKWNRSSVLVMSSFTLLKDPFWTAHPTSSPNKLPPANAVTPCQHTHTQAHTHTHTHTHTPPTTTTREQVADTAAGVAAVAAATIATTTTTTTAPARKRVSVRRCCSCCSQSCDGPSGGAKADQ